MLNTPDNYQYGDLKYFHQIHIRRQKADGNIPLKYDQFIKRLRVMNLHDAIYTPRTKEVKSWTSKTPIEDNIRRTQKLKDENVQILDFDEIDKIEKKQKIEPYGESIVDIIERRKKNKNRIQMPKPKQSLWSRFISLFR